MRSVRAVGVVAVVVAGLGPLMTAGVGEAVDGVVLVTQSRALAGGVTPGDAPGFPVTISQPGSYRLASDLLVPAATDGIEITTDDVTLDLNGFAIRGSGGGAGDGVDASDRANIAITNGRVSGMGGNGIVVGSTRITERIHAGIVTGNTAADNGGAGIVAGAGSTVAGNTAVGNGGAGIVAGSGSTLTGNTAVDNGSTGISAGNGSTVTRNTAFVNRLAGIVISRGTVTGNTAVQNTGDGIGAGSGSTLTGNTASGNSHSGIAVTCPCALIGNTAIGNPGGNVVLLGAGCVTVNNAAP